MNERITELILVLKKKGIKQYDFAEKLGVTETAVSSWKTGRRTVTERTIKAICREFDVSYIWLTEGKGDMFLEQDEDDEVTKFLTKVAFGENEFHQNLFKTFAKMDQSEWDALESIVDKYLEISGQKNRD
ncbi:helix-turn-helix transcriptional regulator [uncultured Enterococcus sp.]|uniref:helix-turn-helix domain-containing protein n=1 Tax=uncultured Enterococcus sp. TaxID=167972 RepID=UPI002AA8B682|nr:helix-turn-helix transcriptional regulator [uncultured Enterococcus sp.]